MEGEFGRVSGPGRVGLREGEGIFTASRRSWSDVIWGEVR